VLITIVQLEAVRPEIDIVSEVKLLVRALLEESNDLYIILINLLEVKLLKGVLERGEVYLILGTLSDVAFEEFLH
jgi:hypothetical protein